MLFNPTDTELLLPTARRVKHMAGVKILFPICHPTELGYTYNYLFLLTQILIIWLYLQDVKKHANNNCGVTTARLC
jgi:hypothetical protein